MKGPPWSISVITKPSSREWRNVVTPTTDCHLSFTYTQVGNGELLDWKLFSATEGYFELLDPTLTYFCDFKYAVFPFYTPHKTLERLQTVICLRVGLNENIHGFSEFSRVKR